METMIPYKVRPLQCGHYFHSECLAQWTQNTPKPSCPTCRSEWPTWKPAELINRKRARAESDDNAQRELIQRSRTVYTFESNDDEDDPTNDPHEWNVWETVEAQIAQFDGTEIQQMYMTLLNTDVSELNPLLTIPVVSPIWSWNWMNHHIRTLLAPERSAPNPGTVWHYTP
jgi:hypothetical protein